MYSVFVVRPTLSNHNKKQGVNVFEILVGVNVIHYGVFQSSIHYVTVWIYG